MSSIFGNSILSSLQEGNQRLTNLAAVLFGKVYNFPSAGGIPLYCTITESHMYESKTSQYPVQSGSTVIDNVIQSPTVVRMRSLVSDSPITTIFNMRSNSIVDNIESVSRGVDTVEKALNWKNIGSYSITAMEALIKLQEQRLPITLVTGIKVYNNMILTKMVVPRDPNTGRALFFDLEFSEIMTSTVSISELAIDPQRMSNLSTVQRFSQAISTGTQVLRTLNRARSGEIGIVFKAISSKIGLPSFITSLF